MRHFEKNYIGRLTMAVLKGLKKFSNKNFFVGLEYYEIRYNKTKMSKKMLTKSILNGIMINYMKKKSF